jgi:hypothetical protein
MDRNQFHHSAHGFFPKPSVKTPIPITVTLPLPLVLGSILLEDARVDISSSPNSAAFSDSFPEKIGYLSSRLRYLLFDSTSRSLYCEHCIGRTAKLNLTILVPS